MKRETQKSLLEELTDRITKLESRPEGSVKITVPISKRLEIGVLLAQCILEVAKIANDGPVIKSNIINCVALNNNIGFEVGSTERDDK
jgi:hypothetical protein